MIDSEDHPEMQRASAELLAALQPFVGRRFTSMTFQAIDTLVRAHRSKMRLRGVDFPELAALVVPRIGAVDLLRADLHGDPLKVRILGFIHRHKEATTAEIHQAVRWAFPDYRGEGADGVI